MKKILFILTCFIILVKSSAQDIEKVEYFFDTDPGFGLGTSITLNPFDDLKHFKLSTNVSELSDGFHSVYVRVMDKNGIWSLSHQDHFFKISTTPETSGIEYFIDHDNGFKHQTHAFSELLASNSPITLPVDLDTLSSGFHRLFVRTKDANNKWGLTSSFAFFHTSISDSIQGLEYFFDQDPGFGNATFIPIQLANNSNMVFTLDLNQVKAGWHTLNFRIKDKVGNWSLTNPHLFYKENLGRKVTKLEYFFDHDPGLGNGILLDGLPTDPSSTFEFEADVSELDFGDHLVFVRVEDEFGQWSYASIQSFHYTVITGSPRFEIHNELSTYPNPSNGNINIKGELSNFSNVLIMDDQGNVLQDFIIPENHTLDLSYLNTGVYFLNFRGKNHNVVKKIIKL